MQELGFQHIDADFCVHVLALELRLPCLVTHGQEALEVAVACAERALLLLRAAAVLDVRLKELVEEAVARALVVFDVRSVGADAVLDVGQRQLVVVAVAARDLLRVHADAILGVGVKQLDVIATAARDLQRPARGRRP